MNPWHLIVAHKRDRRESPNYPRPLCAHLSDADECANCAGILEELENIDDDCDRHGIVFVKTKDFSIAEEYGVLEYPALVYFESGVPNVFEGKFNLKFSERQFNKALNDLSRATTRRGRSPSMADHAKDRGSN